MKYFGFYVDGRWEFENEYGESEFPDFRNKEQERIYYLVGQEGEWEEYFTQNGLIKRGWTRKYIKQYLGNFDKQALNPLNSCYAPIKLFSAKRVDATELEIF